MRGITKYIEEELKLEVNREKSKISSPSESTLLGFSFYRRKDEWRIRIADKSVKRMKDKLRMSLPRNKAQQVSTLMKSLNPVIRGWVQYFQLSDLKSVCHRLDELLRSRVRKLFWQKWQKVKTRMRNLIYLGIPKCRAYQWSNTGKGASRVAHSPILQRSLTNHTLGRIGRKSFFQMYRNNVETQLKLF